MAFISVKRIVRNNNVNSFIGISKYLIWQLIKLFNLWPRVIKISNSKVTIPNTIIANNIASTKIYTQNLFDYNNMCLIKYLLENRLCNTFFDIGANVGCYSLIAAENSNIKVVAFEPHPETFALLEKNIQLNGYNNVILNNFALSNNKGFVNFSNDPGGSTNEIKSASDNTTISVKCHIMEDYCIENNLYPDIIKIDIEGHELQVLKGFSNVIKLAKIFFVEITENRSEIEELFLREDFIGPYYFNYKNKKFNNSNIFKDPYSEDLCFINKNFIKVLKQFSFLLD